MDTKKCSRCGLEHSLDKFAWKSLAKQKLLAYCRECQKKSSDAWYRKNKQKHVASVRRNNARYIEMGRQYILDYLSMHPCVDCGESDPIVLEFDHVRGCKIEAVAIMVQKNCSIARIKKEIEKCEVRCANCHRRKTSRENGHYRSDIHR